MGAVLGRPDDPLGDAPALPEPSAPITFTGITEQRQQALVTPTPLLERAAITPATMVPWP